MLELSTKNYLIIKMNGYSACRMVSEATKQLLMARIKMDYSKHTYFQWKIKWRLEHLGALGIMGEVAPLILGHLE